MAGLEYLEELDDLRQRITLNESSVSVPAPLITHAFFETSEMPLEESFTELFHDVDGDNPMDRADAATASQYVAQSSMPTI